MPWMSCLRRPSLQWQSLGGLSQSVVYVGGISSTSHHDHNVSTVRSAIRRIACPRVVASSCTRCVCVGGVSVCGRCVSVCVVCRRSSVHWMSLNCYYSLLSMGERLDTSHTHNYTWILPSVCIMVAPPPPPHTHSRTLSVPTATMSHHSRRWVVAWVAVCALTRAALMLNHVTEWRGVQSVRMEC